MLTMDGRGRMGGACSTSGLAWKLRGRVGDSPIIGAGLFVDDEVGGATATGIGEAVIKVAGAATVVELMRHGKSPRDACAEVLERILHKQPDYRNEQSFLVGFLALSKDGAIGAVSYRKGFQYSVNTDGNNRVIDAEYLAR
jgi:N4-(beta-N-acetylglucosaminyl)-L-asparaginase